MELYNDMNHLAQMRQDARQNPEKMLDTVAGQFESLFTQMMLKEMRNASLGEGIFDNEQTKMFQDMYDKQLTTELSQQSGIGLKEILIRQMR